MVLPAVFLLPFSEVCRIIGANSLLAVQARGSRDVVVRDSDETTIRGGTKERGIFCLQMGFAFHCKALRQRLVCLL